MPHIDESFPPCGILSQNLLKLANEARDMIATYVPYPAPESKLDHNEEQPPVGPSGGTRHWSSTSSKTVKLLI